MSAAIDSPPGVPPEDDGTRVRPAAPGGGDPTRVRRGAGGQTPDQSVPLRPTNAELLDVGLLVALDVVAIAAFRNAYGGSRFLVVGALGVILGAVVAHVAARRRYPTVVVAATTVVVYFVVGAAAVTPDEALFGILPSPAAFSTLVDAAVSGWARLLTTMPPVGSEGGLMAVPLMCGLLSGVVAVSVSRRMRWWLGAALAPLTVLVLGILFGTTVPVGLVLHGSVFGGLLLLWASIRARQRRSGAIQQRTSVRWVGSILTLAVAGALAVPLADHIPGAHAHPRFVLRDRAQPPFDPLRWPSPLAGYRRYTKASLLRDRELFTVAGLDKGERIRLATLDSYDGIVYGFERGTGGSGAFRKVGTELGGDQEGTRREVEIRIRDYSDVWVPSVGRMSTVEFGGPRAAALQSSFRYNLNTGDGADTAGLREGDRYRFTTVIPELPTKKELVDLGPSSDVDLPPAAPVPQLAERTAEYVGAGAANASPYQRVRRIVDKIHAVGSKSDGEPGGPIEPPPRPGHSVDRLAGMIEAGGYMVGNGEQYAPLVALMARQAKVPARVVMGFEMPDDGRRRAVPVKGGDVRAWVEIGLGGTWVPVLDVEATQTKPPPPQEPTPIPTGASPPPPPLVFPSTDDGTANANKIRACKKKCGPTSETTGDGILLAVLTVGGVSLTPFAVVGAFTLFVAWIKRRRRNRRRTTGPPTARIAGGWHELSDLATDLGSPIPRRTTRREAAEFVGRDEVRQVARHADARIFGPGEPDDVQVADYWQDVDLACAAMTTDLTKFERWKATVSLASLRPGRRRRGATYTAGGIG